jgi:hypothetical protein
LRSECAGEYEIGALHQCQGSKATSHRFDGGAVADLGQHCQIAASDLLLHSAHVQNL